MRRVLVTAWGADASVYSGRAMTLYRDEAMAFGGQPVGGIRISHLSHIERSMTMALTVTRASRKAYTVKPLVAHSPPQKPAADLGALRSAAVRAAEGGTERFREYWSGLGAPERSALKPRIEEYAGIAKAADAATTAEDPFAAPSPAITPEGAMEKLRACSSEAELEAAWEALPVKVCRELGAEVLDEIRATFTVEG